MRTIFNYLVLAIVIYFSVNWIADNPKMMKTLKTKMNSAVSAAAGQVKKAASTIEASNAREQSI
jgi:hypothetical protein|tara:strand:- start:237 stop:428 length:192 start_codon:yes stop_codon:yes gene_type:complete